MSLFKINGIAIKNPDNLKIERFNVTTLQRLANAEMVGDLIAKKLKFFFTYEAITGYELDHILDIIWETNELFFTLDYVYNGVAGSSRVYTGSIPTELHRAGITTNWVWKNVTINFIGK